MKPNYCFKHFGFVTLEAGLMLIFLIPLIAAGVLTASYVIFLQDLDSSVSTVLNGADLKMYGTSEGDQSFRIITIGLSSLGDDGGTGHYVIAPLEDNQLNEAAIEVRDSFDKLGQNLLRSFKSKIDPWCNGGSCQPSAYEVAVRVEALSVSEGNGDYRGADFGPSSFSVSAHRYYGTLEHPHRAGELDPLFRQIFDVLKQADSAALAIFSPLKDSSTTQYFGNYNSYMYMSPASLHVGGGNNRSRQFFHSLAILGARAFVDITQTRIGDFLSIFPTLCTSLGGRYNSDSKKCTRILIGSSKVTNSRLQL